MPIQIMTEQAQAEAVLMFMPSLCYHSRYLTFQVERNKICKHNNNIFLEYNPQKDICRAYFVDRK